MTTTIIDDLGVDLEAANQLLDNTAKLETLCTEVEAKFEATPTSSKFQSWTIPLAAGLGIGLVLGMASAGWLL